MTFLVHNQRYEGRSQLHTSLEWPNMRIEHRSLNSAVLPAVTCTCTGLTIVLAGRSLNRWLEDGVVRRVVPSQPGITSILPVSFEEKEIELVSPLETLHIYLAPSLTVASALTDFDIDPSKVEVVRSGGVSDPLLKEVAAALHRMISRPPEPTDRLFIDGAGSMLSAHLVSKYSNIAQRAAPRSPGLSYQKLTRVLDLVECRFADAIGLDELAAEACLSPFHFSRLFQKAQVSPLTDTLPNAAFRKRRANSRRGACRWLRLRWKRALDRRATSIAFSASTQARRRASSANKTAVR